jgi:16S rRNA (cytosine967-C5)-methyltransferase
LPTVIATKIEVVGFWLRVERGAYLDKVLPELRHSKLNADLAEFLLRGMIDHRLELFWAAGRVYPRFDNFPPRMRALLLLSIFQLRYTDVPASLVVNEAVDAVRKLKLNRLTGAANAGLRKPQIMEDPVADDFSSLQDYLAVRTSLPVWILEILMQDYPDVDPLIMAEGFAASRKPWLRRVRQSYSLQKLQLESAENGIELQQSRWSELYFQPRNKAPAAIAAVRRGDLIVHDVSAAAAVELLAPDPGARVLDGCSAPGGKLRQLLELQPDLKVTGVEKDAGRLRALKRLLTDDDRINLLQADLIELDEVQFDYILLDVPCSGSGNFGKKPDSRYKRGRVELEKLLPLQRELLRAGAKLLRPGGRLVYSTCSLFREENEQQVQDFLNEQPDFYPGDVLNDKLPRIAPGQIKFTPWEHQTGGAYAASLMRKPDVPNR